MATIKERMRFAVGALRVLGISGASSMSVRLVGGWTTTGAPASGTFKKGDFGFDGNGDLFFCTVAGAQGTWVAGELDATGAHLAGIETFTGAKSFSGGLTVLTTNMTITDKDIVLSATTGTKIGTAASQKLSLWGVAPAAQPSAFTQTYVTATKTHANPTSATLTDSSGGTSGGNTIAAIGGAVDPTAALLVPTQNAISTLAAMVNKLTADVVNVKGVLNAVIDDGQAVGNLS